MKILEDLVSSLDLRPGMRVLDLGCGKGLTSIFLAKEFGVTVFAADLWISATENYNRFAAWGLGDQIIPVHAEAHALPFAEGYFDAAISIDAYHYFGAEADYLDQHFAPLVKAGGIIAIAMPGLKAEFGDQVPEVMQPFWEEELERTFHSPDWWRNLWRRSEAIQIRECGELQSCEAAWRDWLNSGNEYAREDAAMMEAEGGRYFNIVGLIAEKLG